MPSNDLDSSINFNDIYNRGDRYNRRNTNGRNQQRIQRQRRRIITRMYRRRAMVNNAYILRRIAQLPLQIKTIHLQIKCSMDLHSNFSNSITEMHLKIKFES
ncbi:hypothetical protein RclHR1_00620025 [Rhizophagus clarus]|uniref:Uncharacterized protein n=1 Tax=Rhizophagus clarus TaxID=94130 RepID=A0A2Z6S3D2_9GLOM|nr:hypothetical protein RclHR1_00620025 [Rhizophagus clarus]GES99880.1 hypothetical protein RCL_jg2837.t1 [Rhizophagus clarus]